MKIHFYIRVMYYTGSNYKKNWILIFNFIVSTENSDSVFDIIM